jgi:hypothetical protein
MQAAPQAPAAAPPAPPAAASAPATPAAPAATAQATSGPANICSELVAFLRQPPQSTNAPAANPPPPKKASMTIEQAEALAQANDIKGCKEAAQKTRAEGVPMPGALIAMAAADLKYLETTTQR